jgi:hypothetical protein
LRNRSLNATDHVDKIYPVYNTEAEAAAAAIYERDRRLKAAGAGLLERILTAIFHPGGFFDYGVLAGYGFSGGAVGRGWQTDPIPLAYEVNPGIYLEMPQPGPGQELYGSWPEAVGPRANPVKPRAGDPAAPVAPAHNAANAARLNEHLRQLEKYGSAGFKELQNGRFRYFGDLTPPRTPGTMAGTRRVREWDPGTGATRTWFETLDDAGRVRIVRPETGGPKIHYMFDEFGNFTGTF